MRPLAQVLPSHFLIRLVNPVMRRKQKKFARESATSVLKAVCSP
jgi:hypothetical protein